MNFIDLFSGIGGFRLGMEQVGHSCIGYCENNPFARKSYQAIFNTEGEVDFEDITTVTDESIRAIGSVDIITAGFPCQAFSIAGNRRGFEDTRGTMFFEIARFVTILKPKYLFLENVRGLLNHAGGSFATILSALDELGYNVEWQVLNSKHFGVPQDRARVFLVGHLRGAGTRPIFPLGSDSEQTHGVQEQQTITNTLTTRYPESQGNGSYIIEGQQSSIKLAGNLNPSGKGMNGNVYQSDGLAPTVTTNKGEGTKIIIAGKLPGSYDQSSRVYDVAGLSPTLSTMSGGHQEPKIIQRSHGYNKGGSHDVAPTLTSSSYHENNYVSSDYRIRKLTPRECWRLQGFPDWAFDKAQAVNSNSQLYKQAGNSVTVPVVAAIAKQLR